MAPTTWLLAIAIIVATATVLLILYLPRVGELFHQHVPDRPKRRLFLAAVGFFTTFALAARWLSWLPATSVPFVTFTFAGHMSITGLGDSPCAGCGVWLAGRSGHGQQVVLFLASRLMSLLYGVGAALTLDEFAIWLNLQEGVYWTRRDRASLDAVLLFGALLLIGLWDATSSRPSAARFSPHAARRNRDPAPSRRSPSCLHLEDPVFLALARRKTDV